MIRKAAGSVGGPSGLRRSTLLTLAVLLLLASCATSSGYEGSAFGISSERRPSKAPDRVPAPVDLSVDGHLDLARCLETALTNNPRLRAAHEAVRAEAESRAAATALPDPMLRFGWFAESVQTRTGAQKFMLGFSQMIPWPGKLVHAGRIVDVRTKIASLRHRIVMRDLLRDVSRRYHEIDYLAEAVETSDLIEAALQRVVDLALRGREPRAARLPEVVRAELELERVRHDRLMLSELLEVEREGLRAQLALPRTTPVPSPHPPVDLEMRARPEALLARAELGNYELRLAGLKVEAARAKRSLAEQGYYPDFSAGGRWISTDERSDAAPLGNGDDPLLFEFGMTLPLQLGAKRARVSSAEARVRQAALERSATQQGLRSKVYKAWWRAANARRVWSLYRDTLLPQAREAALAAEALFGEGKTTFLSLIETQIAWSHHRLSLLRARSDYFQALATLEAIIGVPFTRVTVEGGR